MQLPFPESAFLFGFNDVWIKMYFYMPTFSVFIVKGLIIVSVYMLILSKSEIFSKQKAKLHTMHLH